MAARKDSDPRNARLAKRLHDAARVREQAARELAARERAHGRFYFMQVSKRMFGGSK